MAWWLIIVGTITEKRGKNTIRAVIRFKAIPRIPEQAAVRSVDGNPLLVELMSEVVISLLLPGVETLVKEDSCDVEVPTQTRDDFAGVSAKVAQIALELFIEGCEAVMKPPTAGSAGLLL
jgi:hypothetical protein